MLGAVTLGSIAAIVAVSATVTGGIVGMFFRAAAAAWKTERDAAVDKALRLDDKVADQAKEIDTLKSKVAELEKRTDFDVYAERSARDHKLIMEAIRESTKGLHANTTALEFLIKQAFPQAALAFPTPDDERNHHA